MLIVDKQEIHDNLKKALDAYLGNRPDAYRWLFRFRDMCHALDDIIDIPERRADNQFIGRVSNLYVEVLSDDFYSNRRPHLYPVVKQCHHFYFNSVAWEHSDVSWKANYADVIRCCTNNMVVAVVELVVLEETGNLDVAYEAARDIALLSATKSWCDHHSEDGTPI